MKQAVFSIWQGRIAPVFDVSRRALVVNADENGIVQQEFHEFSAADIEAWLELLLSLDSPELVCGAISRPLRLMLHDRGVNVVPFVSGDQQTVIQGWLGSVLNEKQFAMPGCCGGYCHRHRRFNKKGGQ